MTDSSAFRTPEAAEIPAQSRLAALFRLPRALRGEGRLRFPACETVMAEWDRLRAGRIAPARSEIAPAGLAEVLEFMFVAEIIAPGVARLRLAGQRLYTVLGMEPRGMPLCCLMQPPARAELAEAVKQVAHGARVHLPLRAPRGLGRPGMDGLLLMLPLTDGDGRITRVLGVLETHGQVGRTPRRFDLAGAASPVALTETRHAATCTHTGAASVQPLNRIANRPVRDRTMAPETASVPASVPAPAKTRTCVPGARPVAGRAGWGIIDGGVA